MVRFFVTERPPQISYKRKSLKRVGRWILHLGWEDMEEGRRKVTFLGEEFWGGEEEGLRIR
jgi:hypothetical protein